MTVSIPSPQNLARLMLWRAQALTMQPYMASILLSLKPVDSDEIDWFAVDSHLRLYVNFATVVAMDDDRFAAQALLHECGHVFGRHDRRAKEAGVASHQFEDWNIAGDAAINDDLLEAGHADRLIAHKACYLGTTLGEPLHQTAEHYFAAIQARRPSGTPSPGQGGPYSGCGSIAGGQPAPGEIGSDDLGGQADPTSPLGVDLIVMSTAQAVVEYAGKRRGTVPGGLLDTAARYLAPPQVPWRQELHGYVGHSARQVRGHRRNTFGRLNRRFHKGIPMGGGSVRVPGHVGASLRIAAIRDTSGSMSVTDLTAVNSEIVGIAARLGVRGKDLIVLDVDADVARIEHYQAPIQLSTVAGRGGTDMRVGIAHALTLMPTPDIIIVITDGETPWPSVEPDVPVIACIVSESKASLGLVPAWMKAVHIAPHTVSA